MEKIDIGIENLTNRMSSKSQAIFLKLQITVREVLKLTKKQFPDIKILCFFTENSKDFEKSLEHIKKHLKWREEKKHLLKQALEMDPKAKFTAFKENGMQLGYFGTTKKGQPIEFLKFSKTDPWIVLKELKQDDFLCYKIQTGERMLNIIWPLASEKNKKMIDGVIFIIDVKDLPLKSMIFNSEFKKFMKHVADIYDENYPCLLKKTYVINCGFFFKLLWGFTSYFVGKKVLDKVCVLNDGYLQEFEKIMDVSKLPKCYGGQVDEDIGTFRNFWDDEIDKSVREKRFHLEREIL